MARAGAAMLCIALMAGCADGGQPKGPYAPGIAAKGASVDAMVVGHRLMAAGEYELAMDAFSRAALDQGLSADVLAGLGSANLQLGRLGQAEDLLRQAIKTDEAAPSAWNNLGVVLMEQGKVGEAEQVLRRAYALDNGQSDSIRDNLRLALAKLDNSGYGTDEEQDYKLVRQGSSEYLIRTIP